MGFVRRLLRPFRREHRSHVGYSWLSVPLAAWRRLTALARLFGRWTSRREWTVRLLGLEISTAEPDACGVVLLQIDGLSRRQFEHALERGRMPFIRKLWKAGDHRLESFYSGLPSTTPAVQAELFYGVTTAVPAFAFRDSETGQIVEMIQPSAADKIEKKLAHDAVSLLEGGSAYSNIFSGGAPEPHFCVAAMGAGKLFAHARHARAMVVVLWNLMAVIRSLGLLVAEFAVAVTDFCRGILKGHDVWTELKLVPSRVIAAVLIREMIAISMEADAIRGLPVMHANFVGYDEQAHGRGPGSAMAQWSLRQIDGAIARIVRAARASRRRDYQVWIYSDHGQQASTAYERLHKRTLEAVVNDHLERLTREPSRAVSSPAQPQTAGARDERATRWNGLWPRPFAEVVEVVSNAPRAAQPARAMVAAKGPLGHIYLPAECDQQVGRRLADALAREAGVPWVFMPRGTSGLEAWHGQSRYELPEDAPAVFGTDHPFLDALTGDMERVCRHPDAGDLIISGWQQDGPTVSFVRESGSHAGPGPDETGGFILVPSEVRRGAERPVDYWRPAHLRHAVLKALGRDTEPAQSRRPVSRKRAAPTAPGEKRVSLRIMTYNIHSCIGMDGRLSPARIARVIAACDPDVVALQEVDVGRAKTGLMDQAAWLANQLAMDHVFQPTMVSGSERYGNAILSRVPFRLRAAGLLPVLDGAPRWEPRGVVWIIVPTEAFSLQLFATHLGLSRPERHMQIAALFGADWLGHPQCDGPVVLCGDFNAHARSPTYRQLTARFRDAQHAVAGHRPRNTWLSQCPLLRLDHVLLAPQLVARSLLVPDTYLARVASDHRPVLVELEI
jgi:endonuclease/exonuclease/phosphatase family metal-dependent hydrolase